VLRTGTGSPNQWVANIRNFSFGGPVEFEFDKTELNAALAGAHYFAPSENRYTAANNASVLFSLSHAGHTKKELSIFIRYIALFFYFERKLALMV